MPPGSFPVVNMASGKKKRDCPALGRVIKRDECGRWRHSEVDCPQDCVFNPFGPGQYVDHFIEFESKVLEVVERSAFEAFTTEQKAAFERHIRNADDIGFQGMLLRGTQVDRDDAGRNVPERLLADPQRRLKNDERTLLQGLARSRPAFLEVRRIIDDLRIEVIDRMDPSGKRLLVCDRSIAARACRFDEYHLWIYPTPHFYRLRGTVIPFTEMPPLSGWEAFCEMVRHLGGDPTGLAADPGWILDNGLAIRDLQERVHRARQRGMAEGLDAWYWSGSYMTTTENGSEKLVELLQKNKAVVADRPDTESDDFAETHRWTWLDETRLDRRFKPTWGVVRYNAFRKKWRIEADNTHRYESLKAAFEKTGEGILRPVGEEKKNLAEGLWEKAGSPEEIADVPASLLQEIDSLGNTEVHITSTDVARASPEKLAEDQFRELFGEPLPALGNKPIAEAAADPEFRGRAARILKMQINSLDNIGLKYGTVVDVQDLIESTGIEEVLEPLPPVRARPPEMEEPAPFGLDPAPSNEAEEAGFSEILDRMDPEEREEVLARARQMAEEAYLERPVCQRLRRRLSYEEAANRVLKGLQEFGYVDEILTEMTKAVGGDIISDMEAVMEEFKIGKSHRLGLFVGITSGWLALVKPGHRIRRLTREELAWRTQSILRQFDKEPFTLDVDLLVDRLADSCEQPAAVEYAVEAFIMHMEEAMERGLSGPPPRAVLLGSVFIRAFIDCVLHNMGTAAKK